MVLNIKTLAALALILPFYAVASTFDADDDYQSSADTATQSTEFKVPGSVSQANQEVDSYKISALDLLNIEVFRVDDLRRTVRVNSQGIISLPLVGTFNVMGLTVPEVQKIIEERLEKDYMQDPHVSVFIKEFASQNITINGWVERPGVYPLKGKTTLIQAISMASGIKRLGNATEVVIFRQKAGVGTTGYKVNFEDVQAGRISDPVLVSNDIVVVPEHGSKAAFEETTRTIRTFLGFIPFL